MRKRFSFPGPLVIPPFASHVLDSMRVVAALLVMLSHLRNLFFVNFGQTEHKSSVLKAIYLLTGLGHESVIIFFVLSGLLIGMSVLRVHARNGWSWTDYLLQRLSRLWVVLLPALLLTYLWDSNGIRLFGMNSVYAGLPSDKSILGYSTIQRLNFPTFLGNVFFLQTLRTESFGSNGPLWSLAYEFWYYLAFPCLLLLFTAPNARARLLYGLSLVGIAAFVGREVTFYFVLWMMGVAILFLPRLWKEYRSASPIWVFVSVLILLLSLTASALTNNDLFSYAIGIGCLLSIYFVFRLPQSDPATHVDVKSKAEAKPPLIKRLADFSYSLYLLHLPPLVFLHGYFWNRGLEKWQPTPTHLAAGTGIALAIIAYAYLISLLTEAHTDKVRRWVKKTWFSAPSRTV